MTETWLPVPGWEGFYSVSDSGRVRSESRAIKARDGRTIPIVGRVLRQTPNADGHLCVSLSRHGKARTYLVHQLVLRAFVGEAPSGTEACHADDDKANNHLPNLRWDTRSANMLDRTANGRDRNAAKTHCAQNHPFSDANTYRYPDGSRRCRVCRRAATERHETKKRTAA